MVAGAMKLGLYGGSFDPIHHGHLLLARQALEELGLERILFVPAAHSPHKLSHTPTAGDIRREMVSAAIEGEPGFALEDCELRRGGPSYAIDTVSELRARWPEAEFHYLIGQDNVAKLSTWHRFEDLAREVRFVVFGRGPDGPAKGFATVDRRVDISATNIRERVACGRSIRYLVPEAVRQIIGRHHLYKEHSHHL